MLALLLLACTSGDVGKAPADSGGESVAVDSRAVDTDSAPVPDSDSVPTESLPPPCDTAATWYVDEDGDGVGTEVVTDDCAPGAAPVTGDCDDTRATVFPGGPERATSGRDDNCDGVLSGVYVPEVPVAPTLGRPISDSAPMSAPLATLTVTGGTICWSPAGPW